MWGHSLPLSTTCLGPGKLPRILAITGPSGGRLLLLTGLQERWGQITCEAPAVQSSACYWRAALHKGLFLTHVTLGWRGLVYLPRWKSAEVRLLIVSILLSLSSANHRRETTMWGHFLLNGRERSLQPTGLPPFSTSETTDWFHCSFWCPMTFSYLPFTQESYPFNHRLFMVRN